MFQMKSEFFGESEMQKTSTIICIRIIPREKLERNPTNDIEL